MLENLVSASNISFILVFIEGLISFFSPCILPLLPVYMSYLAGNAKHEENGILHYDRKKVFFHTIFFVLGISFAFYILGMSFTALGSFFQKNQSLFTKIAGIIIVVLGLFQLGVFEFKFLQKERRIKTRATEREVNPLIAFIMGFTFSFAWTPCIGPMLSSVLVLASSAKNGFIGNLLVLVYTLGFIIPFLLLGLFTTQILEFLRKKRNLLKYIVKAGGVILIIIGIMTFTGWMNGVSGYLNSVANDLINKETETDNGGEDPSGEDATGEDINGESTSNEDAADEKESSEDAPKPSETTQEEEEESYNPAIDFTLTDQYGNEHTLSDYEGKVVFLNFWATWCPPCKKEMPDIEKLYNEYNLNQDEVVFLGIAHPRTEENPNNKELPKEGVIEFLEENEYTFPTVFDETGEIFSSYYIQAFPTTFFINKEGNLFGYYPGMMTESIMRSAIEDTINSTN